MANIMIAWELGGGLGHIMRVAALARELSAKGHEVFAVLRHLPDSSFASWPTGTRLLQAPKSHRRDPGFKDLSTYADILFASGYHDARTLGGLVIGWSSLIELIEPVVIVADHSPTACLVARLSDIPLVRFGSGFCAPPQLDRYPVFRTWSAVDLQRLEAVHAQVLQSINAIAGSCALSFDSIAQALQPDLDLVTSWPQLDHYAQTRPPGSVEYVGHELVCSSAVRAEWPEGARSRVLAYLKADYGGFEGVVAGLRRPGVSTVAYISGIGERQALAMCSDNFHVSTTPIDLIEASRHCDALVCHAGVGTVDIGLDAGKPVVLLPTTAEQLVYAKRVHAVGAGLIVDEESVAERFGEALDRVLSDARFAGAARSLGASRKKVDATVTSATRILELITSAQGDH